MLGGYGAWQDNVSDCKIHKSYMHEISKTCLLKYGLHKNDTSIQGSLERINLIYTQIYIYCNTYIGINKQLKKKRP